MTQATDSPGNVRPPQITPRRVIRLVLLVAIAVGLFYLWERRRPPAPPELPAIDLTKAEEPVAAALEAAMKRVRHEPRDSHAWGFLGEVLLAHGYLDESVQCFERAAEFDPAEPRWVYFQAVARGMQGKDCVPLLERSAALCDEHAPEATAPRLALVERLLEQRRYDEADAQLRRVEAVQADDVRVVFNRGLLALRRNDLEAARAAFERVLDSPFARQKACANLAMIYQARNEPERAAQYSDKARQAKEDFAWEDPYVREYSTLDVSHHARLRRANELDDAHRTEEASSVIEELLQDSRTELNQLAFATSLSKRGRYEESIEALNKLLKENPNKVQAHYTLGMTHFYLGVRLERRPDKHAEATAHFQAAVASCRRAIELKPNHAFAYLFIGRSLERMGQSEEALAALRRCVELRPESASTHLHLGDALASLGKDNEALEQLEIAVRLAAPDDTKPRIALQRLRDKMSARPK